MFFNYRFGIRITFLTENIYHITYQNKTTNKVFFIEVKYNIIIKGNIKYALLLFLVGFNV